MMIHPRCTNFKGLFSEDVIAHFAFNSFGKNTEINIQTYPLAAKAVLEHCYRDDLMPSAPTVDEAKETRRQLTELGDQAGFHIRKWVSNDVDVIADIKEEDRASEIDLEKREFRFLVALHIVAIWSWHCPWTLMHFSMLSYG